MPSWDEFETQSGQRKQNLKRFAIITVVFMIGVGVGVLGLHYLGSAAITPAPLGSATITPGPRPAPMSNLNPALIPADYFPIKLGMKWRYAITIGAQEPISYERVYWPVGSGAMVSDTRGRFIPETTRKVPSPGDRFTLQLRVKGRSAACGMPNLEGFEVEILQDDLGVLSGPIDRSIKAKLNSLPSIYFVDAVGRDETAILLARVHDATEGGAPSVGGFGAGIGQDGCSVRVIFFNGAPGQQRSMGSQASDHLIFLGNSEMPNGQGQQGLHFQRSVDAGKPSPSERTSSDDATFMQDAFIEDTWFEKGRGLGMLIQRRNDVETMRWTLIQASE